MSQDPPPDGCRCGKTRHLTRKEARHAASKLAAYRKGRIRTYQCDGGFWHVTTKGPAYAAYFRRRS
jgi:hypothetical protein